MFGIIYAITNRINCKNHVGQTTRTLEQRFAELCRTQEQLDEREEENSVAGVQAEHQKQN